MALDGIVIAGVVHQLNQTILNTKIAKIAILVQHRFCILPDALNQNGRSSVSAPAASKSVGAGAGAWDG